jgi:hypothetical protein
MIFGPAFNAKIFFQILDSINFLAIKHRKSIACNSWVKQENED